MSIRTRLFAIAALAALAAAAFSPTGAFARGHGGGGGNGHGQAPVQSPGGGVHVGPYHPGCGQVGCNMHW